MVLSISIIASASIVFITDMSNSKNWGGVLAISIAIVGNSLSNINSNSWKIAFAIAIPIVPKRQ